MVATVGVVYLEEINSSYFSLVSSTKPREALLTYYQLIPRQLTYCLLTPRQIWELILHQPPLHLGSSYGVLIGKRLVIKS
jgi:hypothetical protein